MNYFDPVTERDTRFKFTQFKNSFITCPDQWETLFDLHETLDWKEMKFDEANRKSLPETEGLYMMVVSPKKVNAMFVNYLFYVGETKNLRQRFGDYLDKVDAGPKSGQYKVYALIDELSSHLYFRYTEFPGLNQRGRREIENQFLIAFMPPANTKYPQQLQSIILRAYGK